MQTTESLKRRMKSAGDLLSVVKTMKALAAVSIRQYQRAVDPRQAAMAKRLKFLAGMKPLDGKATVYICENYACRAPTNDLEKLKELLDAQPPKTR